MSERARRSGWLDVPAASYDAHMSDASVGQAQLLSAEFADALYRMQPKSVAVLGAATGNGFEHLVERAADRVVAVDINPEYLAILAERFGAALPGLQTAVVDVMDPGSLAGGFDLIWAALIFEYVDPPTLVANCAGWLNPGGVLAALLQQPTRHPTKVSASPWQKDLAAIEPELSLVELDAFAEWTADAGLRAEAGAHMVEVNGKGFFIGDFRRTG
jgi:SAM-dependent methyltransferase